MMPNNYLNLVFFMNICISMMLSKICCVFSIALYHLLINFIITLCIFISINVFVISIKLLKSFLIIHVFIIMIFILRLIISQLIQIIQVIQAIQVIPIHIFCYIIYLLIHDAYFFYSFIYFRLELNQIRLNNSE